MKLNRRGAAGLGLVLVAGLVTAMVAAAMTPEHSRPPNALWWVVRGLCVPDQRLFHAPAPCLKVDLKQGWALVKDNGAGAQILLVPLRRLSGIESPRLLDPGAPNYWQYAWNARSLFSRLVARPTPRPYLALAINSVTGRTQNQLHIHLSCIGPQTAARLGRRLNEIDETWRPLAVPLPDHPVLVRRLYGAQFGGNDPFKLLATEVPGARTHMAAQSLAAVGVVFPDGRPGFVLINHQANPATGDLGSGEDILDYSCQILSHPTSRSPG
jgi:CDP-diacylglycerol pyrophosphatase